MKYVPLTDPAQLKKNVVLVDKDGNRRQVIGFLGGRGTLVALTHKNTNIKGSVWKWKDLMQMGDRVEIPWYLK